MRGRTCTAFKFLSKISHTICHLRTMLYKLRTENKRKIGRLEDKEEQEGSED